MTSQESQSFAMDIKDSPVPTRVESLCVACHQNGETILLLTKIPFFKEMLIGSFNCENCGNRNNQIQFAGELPPRGVSVKFKVTENTDLNREIIKSQFASIKFEELGLQIPQSKRAQLTTVEGLLLRVEQNLEAGQQQRKIASYQTYQKINQFIERIKRFKQGKVLPFTITLYDPSGNSYVKNPFAPKLDDRIFISYFTRTKQDLQRMGYSHQNAVEQSHGKCQNNNCQNQHEIKQKVAEQDSIKKIDYNQSVTDKDFMQNQASVFQTLCHSCQMPGLMKLCQTSIPHFTDLIIMSFSCDFCGAHSTETKNSGIITNKSSTITLIAISLTDLKRDLFKSQTCRVKISEIQLELDYGTLGGVFTTVEGLMQKITDHMEELNTYTDSDDDYSIRMNTLVKTLKQMQNGDKQFTLILQDPLSNSFLSNPYQPQEDKNATTVSRQRTQQQIDYLGLNEMSV